MKTKRTSQYANEHGSDSARFEHSGGSTDTHAVQHAYLYCMRNSRVRAYVILVTRISRDAHDTPPRVQHFSAFHYITVQ